MSAYLGRLGSLFPVECEAAGVTSDDAYTFRTTLEGRRKAQFKPRRPRIWKVSMGLSSSIESSNLLALDSGEFGKGPFAWISDEAQATNALTPDVSTCGPSAILPNSTVTAAGPLALPGQGVAGRSLRNSNASMNLQFGTIKTPVLPGQIVTGSAWLVGLGAGLTITWYDAADQPVGAPAISPAAGIAGTALRVSLTATPPVGAASCLLAATSTMAAARPAITWLPSASEWTRGMGCVAAVVSQVESNAVVLGSTTSHSEIAFVITELG